MKCKELVRQYRANSQQALDDLREALDNGQVKPHEFSIRELAEESITTKTGEPCGVQWVRECCNPNGMVSVMEASDAVDSTTFSNITGQLLISAVLQGYQQEAFILSGMVPDQTTRLSGEIIPGIGLPQEPGDTTIVHEGEEYPRYGVGEEYIQTPATVKRGLIIPVTREAVFFDRTGLILQRANSAGEILGLQKEKRLIDILIGATNNYQEKRVGMTALTARNTYYGIADTTPPWINHQDNNELDNVDSIDAAEQLFAAMTDPGTGEPIVIGGRSIIVPPAKLFNARQLVTASEVRRTTDTNVQTLFPNPLSGGGYSVSSSALLYARLQSELGVDAATAQGYWFFGDPARAFKYMQNWPITVTQAPTNSTAEFEQDIVTQYKASERGVAAVVEPRAIQRHRTLATSSSGS